MMLINATEVLMDQFNWTDDHYVLDPFEYYHQNFSTAEYAVGVLFAIFIIVCIVTNVLGLTFLIRCRMWLRHEGYLYLVGFFAVNIGVLIFDSTSFCLTFWSPALYPPNSSEFMCKVWHFFMGILFAAGWLSVALLFNVFLREQLVHRRRCGCPILAAKYCTLFASKIIVGVIFGVVFILGLPYMGTFRLHNYVDEFRICDSYHHVASAMTLLLQFCLMWVLPFVFFMPVILLLNLCVSRDGDRFGFSQIEDRSVDDEQFRTLAITLACMTCFSQFSLGVLYVFFSAFVWAADILLVSLHIAFVLSLGFQPILCVLIVTKLRAEVLQQLQSIGFCRRFIQNHSPSSESQNLRLQEVHDDDGEEARDGSFNS